MQRKLLGIISIDLEVTSYLLIIYCAFVKYLRKWEHNEAMHQLFLGFKKAYDSVSKDVLYNTVTEFVIPMEIEIEKKSIQMKPTAASCLASIPFSCFLLRMVYKYEMLYHNCFSIWL